MINKTTTNITWEQILNFKKQQPYFKELFKKVNEQYRTSTIYPPYNEIFNALKLCPFNKIKVVILGQDPYHKKNQSHGLCFSVTNHKPPPSLKNIFKSIKYDLGIDSQYLNGNLEPLAKQGVLLLNTILTVQEGMPLSHKHYGWQKLSDYFISQINEHLKGVVFLLWGNEAKEKHIKQNLINTKKHFVFTSSHPSPLGAWRGFLKCKHFSKTNKALNSVGKSGIIW
jgi:uracil-DNA glycosylase